MVSATKPVALRRRHPCADQRLDLDSPIPYFIIHTDCILCVVFVASVNNFLVKPYVGRLRPCCDPETEGLFRLVRGYCDGNYSFFSSHAANTSAVAVYFSRAIRRRWLTCCLVAWCLLNCYTRLYLAQHYPSDILCGLLFGTCSALLFFRLSKRLTLNS